MPEPTTWAVEPTRRPGWQLSESVVLPSARRAWLPVQAAYSHVREHVEITRRQITHRLLPNHVPSAADLETMVASVARNLEVELPPCNTSLLVCRYLHELQLPQVRLQSTDRGD